MLEKSNAPRASPEGDASTRRQGLQGQKSGRRGEALPPAQPTGSGQRGRRGRKRHERKRIDARMTEETEQELNAKAGAAVPGGQPRETIGRDLSTGRWQRVLGGGKCLALHPMQQQGRERGRGPGQQGSQQVEVEAEELCTAPPRRQGALPPTGR